MKTQPLYPQRFRSSARLLLDFILAVMLLTGIILLTQCAPIEDANPLDRPGDEKSAKTLHEENIQCITSNPGFRLAE